MAAFGERGGARRRGVHHTDLGSGPNSFGVCVERGTCQRCPGGRNVFEWIDVTGRCFQFLFLVIERVFEWIDVTAQCIRILFLVTETVFEWVDVTTRCIRILFLVIEKEV